MAESRLLRIVCLGCIYAIPLVVCIRPVGVPLFDPDFWWHLAVGRWVCDHHALPTLDPFTQEHRPWVAYSWLYEVLLFRLYEWLGLIGVVVYRTAMALAVTAAVHRLISQLVAAFLPRSLLTLLATLLLAPIFSERPWLFTVLFATLTLTAVVRLRQERPPPGTTWLLPLVYILWANIHIQFVYGLFLLGLACVVPGSPRFSPAANRRMWQLTVLCVLATLVNPHHLRLYAVVFEIAAQPGPFTWVNELRAMTFREPTDWLLLAFTGSAVYAMGRHGGGMYERAFLVAASWFAFRATRDAWFLVLADVLAVAPALRSRATVMVRDSLAPIVAIGVVAALAVALTFRYDLSEAGLERTAAKVVPIDACRAIADRGLRGPIFNDFDWGGYVIWSLPKLPAALDGRTNLHGDERIERFGRVWAGRSDWRTDADLKAARVVLAPTSAALTELLLRETAWRVEYQDEVAVVFVRR